MVHQCLHNLQGITFAGYSDARGLFGLTFVRLDQIWRGGKGSIQSLAARINYHPCAGVLCSLRERGIFIRRHSQRQAAGENDDGVFTRIHKNTRTCQTKFRQLIRIDNTARFEHFGNAPVLVDDLEVRAGRRFRSHGNDPDTEFGKLTLYRITRFAAKKSDP